MVNADMQRQADIYIHGGLVQAVGPNLKVSTVIGIAVTLARRFLICLVILNLPF